MKETKLLDKLSEKNKLLAESEAKNKALIQVIVARNEGMKARIELKVSNPHPADSYVGKAWQEAWEQMDLLLGLDYQKRFTVKVLEYFSAKYDLAPNDIDLVYQIEKNKFSEAKELCKGRMIINEFDLETEISQL